MDRNRFDAIVRVFAARQSRRATLTALLGAALLGQPVDGSAVNGKGAKKRRGVGKGRRKPKRKERRPQEARAAQSEAACYPGSPCLPGPGKNLGACDFSGSSALKGKNLKGANLGGATVAQGDASGANLQAANLGKACLVDAKLTGAAINSSTNIATAVLCRTTMPDGSENNAGCNRGTPCCPTCDVEHPCDPEQVCCNGRCRTGDCCADAQCTDPAKPICLNFTCSPCMTNRQCGNGKRCCDGQCRQGNCCAAADCGDRACQTKSCPANQCLYEPVANDTPCDADSNACTRNDRCQNGSCVAGTAVVCTPSNACHLAGICDPATGICSNPPALNGTECSGGECVDGVCEVTCLELGQACTSAGECCGPGARDCRRAFAEPNRECCVPPGPAGPGNTCTNDSQTGQTECCPGPDRPGIAALPAFCRTGSCCLGAASDCDTTDQCCQTPVASQCQVVPTCTTAARPKRCCQAAGTACTQNCECCDGYCVDDRCSATCLPAGSRCQIAGECCSLVCDGVSGEGRCASS